MVSAVRFSSESARYCARIYASSSFDMKKALTMLATLTTQVGELNEEVAALKKQPKPTPVKEEKPDTSFAALYGALLINADGSGKKVKHSAELKDSSEDDWLGVWDAKNKVIKRLNEDGSETDEVYESFGDFGTAHYKSLGENNKKKLTHDSNGGWDKVKVLDSVKRKFFSANTLLPMGEKPRSQSRAKSASRRSNAAAAGGGGGAELAIAKPKNSRRAPQPSPKEVAQAAVVLVSAAAHTDGSGSPTAEKGRTVASTNCPQPWTSRFARVRRQTSTAERFRRRRRDFCRHPRRCRACLSK